MSLSLACAISYDSVLIAVTMLATSLILKLIFDESVKKINYKYIIAFGIIGFILLSIKTVYVTVLLPLLFVPKEKYGKGFKDIIKILGIIAGIAIIIYILNKIPSLLLSKARTVDNELAGQQISFVISHPIYYLKIWLKTMISGRNFYITGMFGIFGLIDTYVATAYTAIYIIMLLSIIIADVSLEKNKFNLKYKLIAVFGAIISIFGIFLAMYLLWTSVLENYGVGAAEITGVQGRYFLPLLPLGIVLFSNSVLAKNEKNKKILTKILNNSYIVSFTMLLVSTIAILLRFWC